MRADDVSQAELVGMARMDSPPYKIDLFRIPETVILYSIGGLCTLHARLAHPAPGRANRRHPFWRPGGSWDPVQEDPDLNHLTNPSRTGASLTPGVSPP